jgi:hypothetical protein
MYIHVSKCKNDKIKCLKKTKARRILKYKAERRNKWKMDCRTNKEINKANVRSLKGSTKLEELG